MTTERKHSEVVAMYKDGKTTQEIAEQFGLTSKGVIYILNRRGVNIRERRRVGGRRVNIDFFKTWTNEMAYVLGFIYTDGNISNNTLSISQNERYILEEIKNAMESTNAISERKNGKNVLYTLRIYRKEMIEDLKRIGLTEGKSRVITFPEVPDEYMPHFIRGVIDGDGWIQDRGYVMNVTNASESFSKSLHGVFNERGLNGRITKQGNANRVWVSGKQDVINLADWIYEDYGNLYLRRKRERFYVNLDEEKTPA